MRPAVSALLIGSSALVAGCSGTQAPSLGVVDAQVTERTPEGVKLEFTLEGRNPNDVALPLREVTYALEVDGRRVFSGQRSAEATLRRLGDQRFLLPAVVPASEVAGSLDGASYRLTGTAIYLAPGAFAEVLFDSGLSRPTVSFAGSGTIDAASTGDQ